MAIHLARKKREAAREAGGREDFIPINKDGPSRYKVKTTQTGISVPIQFTFSSV